VTFARRASLLALVLACGPGDRPARGVPLPDQAGLVATRATAVMGDPCDSGMGFRAVWRTTLAPIDRGIGVVTFPDSVIGRRSDTMTIRAAPGDEAPIIARYILRAVPEYSWCYRMEVTAQGITDNSLEVGYESVGLPLDSLTSSSDWARVIFGFGHDSTPERGWVLLEAGRTQWALWPDHFRTMGGFLWNADGLEPEFADGPGGAPAALDLARSEGGAYDFEVQAIAFDGPWMHARIRTPSGCAAPDSLVRETTAWLRYLTDTGRPAVWYATRGC